jgi:putative ABC transport system ATP-binding protein
MLSASDRIVWIRDGTLDKIERREDLDIDVGSVGGDAEGGIESSLRGGEEEGVPGTMQAEEAE